MARWYRLTDAFCRGVKRPGKYTDSPNLVFRVERARWDGVNKSWGFRYTLDGTEHTLGLGAYPVVSLAEAREAAVPLRKQLAAGIDPKAEREKARAARRAIAARLITFREAAQRYIADRVDGWSATHAQDWRASLDTHVLPVIGDLSVADVDTAAVLQVLERDNFWRAKAPTASDCRNRIELIRDWCAARGYCTGANPARWRGHLDKILPSRTTVRPVRHFPSLDWRQVPRFMADLRSRAGVVARALEFTILNASRVSEVVDACWAEFDFNANTWTIPVERMKSGRQHVVPLSPRSLAILTGLMPSADRDNSPLQRDARIFFPTRRGTVGKFLRARMGRPDITVHGFRSSFADWCREGPRVVEPEVREAALAHAVTGKTERAYARGNLLQRRAQLMTRWADYCASPPAKAGATVVPLRA
jgi:integrase